MHVQRANAGQHAPRTAIEHGKPSLLLLIERSGVQRDDFAAVRHPPPRINMPAHVVGSKPERRKLPSRDQASLAGRDRPSARCA